MTFLAVRALHVLMAALWIGSTVFITSLLMPAVDATGPAGGQVMMRINRRGLTTYMTVLGAMTLMTGLYLFWRFTGGFDPGVSTTHAGLAFGIGGAAGILAGVIGGAVVGRNAKKVASLVGRATQMTDGAEKGSIMQQVAALHRRMETGSRIVILLQTVALMLMAVGHYV